MEDDHGFKRSHERKFYNTNVIFGHHEKAYSGIIKDISLGGAFIITTSAHLFSAGDMITVSIPFTGGGKHVKRKGRIKWQNADGFAIEFI